jgi:hypothetical protein
LFDLYHKSLNDVEKAKRSYEAYFNDKFNEATTSGNIPEKVEMSNLTAAYYMDMENTIIKHNSNDVFVTLPRPHLSP